MICLKQSCTSVLIISPQRSIRVAKVGEKALKKVTWRNTWTRCMLRQEFYFYFCYWVSASQANIWTCEEIPKLRCWCAAGTGEEVTRGGTCIPTCMVFCRDAGGWLGRAGGTFTALLLPPDSPNTACLPVGQPSSLTWGNTLRSFFLHTDTHTIWIQLPQIQNMPFLTKKGILSSSADTYSWT